MNIPLHLKIRRIFNSGFNFFLAKAFPQQAKTTTLDIKEIKTIVLIRPNYRIGNIIFLIPLINEIAEHNADIKIDLFIGSASVGKILQPMPNIDKIIDISRKLLLNPFKLYSFIKASRVKKYDLCINIAAGSLSSQIVTLFINSKYTLSFEDEKSWVPLTHKVKQRSLFSHAALQPLEILEGFGIYNYKHKKELDLKLTSIEKEKAKKDFTNLLNQCDVPKNAIIIAIFRNARFDKKLATEWWINFIEKMKELNKRYIFIDILSPDIPTKLSKEVLEYSNKDLRKLAAFFTHCDMFISADTGPLHLAAASGVNSVGLFNHTIIAAYGTLGEHNLNIDLDKSNEQEVAKIITKKILTSEKK